MSYLRGPLTREQIKRLSPDTPVVSDDLPKRPKPSVTASKSGRPVVATGIEEAFFSSEPGTYRPCLVADVTLHYVRASQALDAWERHVIVAPLDEESPWDLAELLDPDDVEVTDDAPEDAEFISPPAGSVSKARFRSYGKQIRTHVYQTRPKFLWRCKSLKLQSKPGETKSEFASRVQLASREDRDAGVEKLRARFAQKIERMQERAKRAEARVEREKSQFDQQKLQAGISMGASVLGAIFGRGGIGRATTAARGAGRVAREREDVQRAEEDLRDLEEAIVALEIEVEEEARAYLVEREHEGAEIEEVVVRPRKSDIEVADLKLGWRPD
jgi:hypothetical protein